MMANSDVRVVVRLADHELVVAALEDAAAQIAAVKAERDEWEERYWDLLSKCGGTAP